MECIVPTWACADLFLQFKVSYPCTALDWRNVQEPAIPFTRVRPWHVLFISFFLLSRLDPLRYPQLFSCYPDCLLQLGDTKCVTLFLRCRFEWSFFVRQSDLHLKRPLQLWMGFSPFNEIVLILENKWAQRCFVILQRKQAVKSLKPRFVRAGIT